MTPRAAGELLKAWAREAGFDAAGVTTVDPPEHGHYRVLLNPWFSPKAINAMEPKIRATINELIDGFIDKGECDVAYDYGRIYPVNPHATEIAGVTCHPTVAHIPAAIDLAVIAVPASAVEDAVEDCIRAGVAGIVLITAGFGETGEEGRRR